MISDSPITILVTGGAGYVGAHACKALAARGYRPVVYDNMVYGHEEAVRWGPLEIGDIADRSALDAVIEKHRPQAVMHFAAFTYVGESVADPGKYYRNNVAGTLSLLEAIRDHRIDRLVFSSTAATYGTPDSVPITEEAVKAPINPYGQSKWTAERMIADFAAAHGLRAAALRYFNAAGADPDGEVGELHDPESHLIPLAMQAATGDGPPLTLFGDDYPTPDGTCIRDYIHVADLADAHVRALEWLDSTTGAHAFNLGTGQGVSVRQVIDAVGQAAGRPVPHSIGPRRAGDPAELVSDPAKANRVLGWTPTMSDLDTIVATAWAWHRREGEDMTRVTRRTFVGGAGLVAASSLTGLARAAQGEAGGLKPMALPPPIGRPERVQRIARAQALMKANNIGAVLVESGPSLDYFTGIQWWRSERLTGVVIPVSGEPIIVTPFFERPSIEEQLGIDAEIRTWNEDQEPLKLVADFLAERRLAGSRIGMEESNRFFLFDRLRRQMPRASIVSANPVVRAARMRKSAAELALMQAASDITIAAFRHAWPRVREGMTKDDIDAIIGTATRALGGGYDGGLVLVGEATAYPHGTRQVQRVQRGSNVLFDCGCDVHGYQSDISRSFVWGADPTVEQRKVWDQMRRGQDIAIKAARLGAPAGSVDDAVRAAYTDWGYGPGYKLPGLSHRTGHGIGMEGHEPVNLVHGEKTPLAIGMCFSNEPGIYLPGKFGIRLEDCFHMTAAGPRYFTQPPRSIDQPV